MQLWRIIIILQHFLPCPTCSSSPGQTLTLGGPAMLKAEIDSVIEVAPLALPGIDKHTLVQLVRRRREGRSRRWFNVNISD